MSYRRKIKRDPEFKKQQDQLKNEVLENIASNANKENVLLECFLRSVLPKTDYNYYLFIKSKGGIPINIKFKYEDYIHALIAITDFYYEAYYFPVAFTDWRDNEGTFDHYKCIYIDIDGMPINTLEMSATEIDQYIKDTYNVPDNLMPQFCISSGSGGMHCIWLTENIFDSDVRDTITQNLICYFQSDHNAFARSHPFRIPMSYNCKRNPPTKSKLIILSDNERYRTSDFEYFNKPANEIDQYFLEEKKKTTAKRLATLAKNKEGRSTPSESAEEKAAEKPTYKHCKDTSDYDTTPNYNVKYYTNFTPKSRYKNLLGDLNNFYIRHGCNICGYRHTFIFLIANYARIFMLESECIELCSQYITDVFYDEMIAIIRSVYASDYTYYYKYSTISKLLNFDDNDIKNSFCYFSDEIKQERNKIKNREYYERKKAKNPTAAARRRAYNRLVIETHIDKPIEELMKLCNLSKSSVYRIRNEILSELSQN